MIILGGDEVEASSARRNIMSCFQGFLSGIRKVDPSTLNIGYGPEYGWRGGSYPAVGGGSVNTLLISSESDSKSES